MLRSFVSNPRSSTIQKISTEGPTDSDQRSSADYNLVSFSCTTSIYVSSQNPPGLGEGPFQAVLAVTSPVQKYVKHN